MLHENKQAARHATGEVAPSRLHRLATAEHPAEERENEQVARHTTGEVAPSRLQRLMTG